MEEKSKKESSTGNEGEEIIKEKEEEKKEKGISENTTTTTTTPTTTTTTTTTTSEQPVVVQTCSDVISPPFENSIRGKIFKYFYEHKNIPISIVELAKNIGEQKESVRSSINTKKELFIDTSTRGKAGLLQVTTSCMEDIKYKAEQYKLEKQQEIERNERIEQENLQRKSRSEELILESRNFFDSYKKEIGESIRNENNVIHIDFEKLSEFSHKLADELISNPEEILQILELALEGIILIKDIRVRIKNIPEDHRIFIENLRAKYVNELIFVEGRVVSITDVRPQCVNAKFECPSCGTIISVLQMEKKFREPSRCSCGRKGGFKLISKEMVDTAKVILEDLQEKTDNPYTRRLNIFIKEDLTNPNNIKIFTPGNEVKIVGILKEIPIPLHSGGLSTRFDIAIEVNSVELSEEEINISKFSDEEIKEIQEVSSIIDKNGLEEINSSFAPVVHGYDEIKNAIILQLCNQRNLPKSDGIRNKPNILLIGDPGVAKSVLGNFAVSITHGARRVVGGGSSAVGITASVIREEEGWRVEPGAFVLARDLLFIDELNNLQDEDKPKLQEAMSEMSVTISKANIRMKMKVTAGALATANPIKGVFKDNEDLVKQFNLPMPIINRFDEIFIMKDNVNENSDEEIANKMISRERGTIKAKYSKEFLKKFFIYVKNLNEPKIDKEIALRLKKLYTKLRMYKTDSININPRVNAAILRLIKASAKIRLSDKVEEKDIERAINILSRSYYNLPDYSVFKEKNT